MANLEELKSGMAIINVAAVVITTAAKSYLVKTASEIGVKARVDAGKETPLRKGNRLLAQYNTDDLISGYDLELTDMLCHPEVVALVDGGVVTNDAGNKFKSYAAPVAGKETVKTTFTLDVYCENRGTGTDVLGYQKLSFPGCTGKPVEWSIKDGEFFAPKFSIRNAPAVGQSPMSMEVVTQLPQAAGG